MAALALPMVFDDVARHRAAANHGDPPPGVRRAARAAGLRYVTDQTTGFTRRIRARRRHRRGGRLIADFEILDSSGRVTHDDTILERVRKLAIPPAWTAVWICPDPRGHLQATGRDARGRKQYRYHPDWRHERDSTKYTRMMAFGRALPRLRRAVVKDLHRPGLPRRKVLATVVKLLETTFIRIGNEEYARQNHSFGLTTLTNHHVAFGRGRVRFHFRGKSGVFHDISVDDPAVTRIVKRCHDLPGKELFQYLDDTEQPVSIGSADVNEYIHEIAGHDFTAKDFRTWAGTVLAAEALHALGARPAERHRRTGSTVAPHRSRPTDRAVVRAIEQVAERLGNTVAVCRKSYVHPHVVAAFLDGTLGQAFDHGANTPGSATKRTGGLRAEERAVLAVLRRRAPTLSTRSRDRLARNTAA